MWLLYLYYQKIHICVSAGTGFSKVSPVYCQKDKSSRSDLNKLSASFPYQEGKEQSCI